MPDLFGIILPLGQGDILYLEWLFWLLSPVMATFLLPLGIVLMLYLCALLIQLFHLRGYLFNISYANTQTASTKLLATLWTAHGKIWHGHYLSFNLNFF